MSRTVLHDDDRGYLLVEGNEFTIGSKIDDPPKIRLTSPYAGGGYISFNSSQAGQVCDGSRQTEIGLWGVKKADDGSLPKAEAHFFLNDGGGTEDRNMRRAFSLMWNKLTQATFGWGSGSAMRSPNGRYLTQQQDDGNLVQYDMIDPAHPRAVWSSWTGPIG